MARIKKHASPLGSSFDSWLNKELKDKEFSRLFESYRNQLELGERLQKIARSKGFSIRKLASKMGTSPSQIQRMFSEEATKCTLETLIRFSIVTKSNLSELLKKRAA